MKMSSLGDLRGAMESIVRDVTEESSDGVAPNHIVLSRLKSDRSTLVDHCKGSLIDMALTKILNDVCRLKRSAKGANGEKDLFGGNLKIPNKITIARGRKKDPARLTIAEARQWLEDHSTRAIESKYKDLKVIYRKCIDDSQSETETVTQVFLRQAQSLKTQCSELDLTH